MINEEKKNNIIQENANNNINLEIQDGVELTDEELSSVAAGIETRPGFQLR